MMMRLRHDSRDAEPERRPFPTASAVVPDRDYYLQSTQDHRHDPDHEQDRPMEVRKARPVLVLESLEVRLAEEEGSVEIESPRANEQLDRPDLLAAVRGEIEARSRRVMALDNADDLRLFGIGQRSNGEGTNESLYKYIPHALQGTVLWTSRDARAAGTLVGARRGVEVKSMAIDEATLLLMKMRDKPLTAEEAPEEGGVDALLEELRCLLLAILQTGASMRRILMTAEQYLDLLRQGMSRW
ncbi:uncharacterized protein FSUBG_13864 [Fusarium subglutinans]|uniref:Uncharacterized protein n=1 Tax=Gibberella subglutinans TaxID=42677 RepID=A0A8H5KNP8_GIBSU|nr:uncharacterized protein FSUBG_13864 [Fusarium subglutinans]KAF5575741.1 hypothetical protein FSUBG_13864 [Fusarium subglutinans]